MRVASAFVKTYSRTVSRCRSCDGATLRPFLNLGTMPLSDRLLTKIELEEEELTFPLEAALCENCGLVQITETVDPKILFTEDYPYYSSFSPAVLAHSRENAFNLMERRDLTPDSLVIELASNDGYLLRNYLEKGIEVLGIDPADGPAAAAEKIGVPTMRSFFTTELARKLREDGRRADVVHANNVLAHVADTNDFVAGIRLILKDTGIAVIEVPYLKPLIDRIEFDTIYHEHLCYFSVMALDKLFRQHALYLNDIKHLAIHGGSLRLYIEPNEQVSDSVTEQLTIEHELGMGKLEYFKDFSQRVAILKDQVLTLLRRLKSNGKTIAAYGAAAKGAVLINYFDIGLDLVNFVVDRNIHKQGKYMPGKKIPIRAPEALVEEMPDYVLILSWNFAEEILEQQREYRARGGYFIIPVPEPHVL